ncbi:MAG: protein kinase [Algisphaera sp.]
MEDPSQNLDTTLGRLVIERGLATQSDINRLVAKQKVSSGGSDTNQRSLASLLVAEGLVTTNQLDRLQPELEEQRAGQQIPGYQIIRKLGAGAMATVYLGKQISLDRMVAIKILPQKFTSNADFVARFYAEGKAAAKLNHPNIVQAVDVNHSGDYHYFVMEFVDGRTVYDDIQNHGPYDEESAVRIGIEVGRALDHSHKQGFVHRDVKPKNIMIADESNRAKLADMGLARAMSDREAAEAEAGKAYGTPYYISPEQIRGERDVDARADIYSLGATLYHMVTGQVPFDGQNPSAVMHKHLKNDLIPPDHINSALSCGISEVIEVCLAKDRSKRYASAADLVDDLEAIQRGEAPMQARKVFDVNALAGLDRGTTHRERLATLPQEPLSDSPAFWLAVAGWMAAAMMAIVLLLAYSSL